MKVTKAFRAVRPGDVYPSEIKVGETVSGRLLEIARSAGCVGANQDAGQVPSAHAPAPTPSPTQTSTETPPVTPAQQNAPPPASPVQTELQTAQVAMPVTPLLETGPRVIRAKLSEAYEGPDETGAVVKLRKGVYVRGETARYFVRIGKATPVETEPPAA